MLFGCQFEAQRTALAQLAAEMPLSELNPDSRDLAYRIACLRTDLDAHLASERRVAWQTERQKRLQQSRPKRPRRPVNARQK